GPGPGTSPGAGAGDAAGEVPGEGCLVLVHFSNNIALQFGFHKYAFSHGVDLFLDRCENRLEEA
ncbi:MAG: hypothetical protein ACKPKO_31235, partial [Candidatus Fonsibacter sp.]